jgi:hypothetical protein
MRKAVAILLLCVPLESGCSLNWLFNAMFDNPHAGGNGSAADRQRTLEWEMKAADEMREENSSSGNWLDWFGL